MLEAEGKFQEEEFYPLSTSQMKPSGSPLWKLCWQPPSHTGMLSFTGSPCKLLRAPVWDILLNSQGIGDRRAPSALATGREASLAAFPSSSGAGPRHFAPPAFQRLAHPSVSIQDASPGTSSEFKFRKNGRLK